MFGALVEGGGEAELVHHPVGLGALAGAAAVVDEGLLQANAFAVGGVDGPVDARCFPESRPRHSIRPHAVLVFSSSSAEEVPFFLPCAALPFCNSFHNQSINLYN